MSAEMPPTFHDIAEASSPSDVTEPSGELDEKERLAKYPNFEELGFSQGAERWKASEIIGEGNFGKVYKAEDQKLGIDVALKVYTPFEDYKGTSYIQFAQREAMYMASLRHPSIPRVYDFGVEEAPSGEKYPFMVTELVDSAKYDALEGRAGYLSSTEVLNVSTQLCDVVEYMASKNVYHYDIKPENIFIPKDLEGEEPIKLVDFGGANLRDAYGTGEYLAPEVMSEGDITRSMRSEVYSIGVSTLEIIKGSVPFDFDETAWEGYKDALNVFAARSEGVDVEKLTSVLQKATAENPDIRYQTPSEFAADLRDALEGNEHKETVVTLPVTGAI